MRAHVSVIQEDGTLVFGFTAPVVTAGENEVRQIIFPVTITVKTGERLEINYEEILRPEIRGSKEDPQSGLPGT